MAKLSANGTEVARYRTANHDEIFNRDVIREFSLRDNGWVLVKVQHGDKSWTPWKRMGRFNEGDNTIRTTSLRKRLEKRARVVEDVTR